MRRYSESVSSLASSDLWGGKQSERGDASGAKWSKRLSSQHILGDMIQDDVSDAAVNIYKNTHD